MKLLSQQTKPLLKKLQRKIEKPEKEPILNSSNAIAESSEQIQTNTITKNIEPIRSNIQKNSYELNKDSTIKLSKEVENLTKSPHVNSVSSAENIEQTQVRLNEDSVIIKAKKFYFSSIIHRSIFKG